MQSDIDLVLSCTTDEEAQALAAAIDKTDWNYRLIRVRKRKFKTRLDFEEGLSLMRYIEAQRTEPVTEHVSDEAIHSCS